MKKTFQQKLNSHLDESVISMLQSIKNNQTTQDCLEHSKCCRALSMTDKISVACNISLALREREGVRVSRAFTLAEVLITLVVIGVVAAVTVPMLLHQEGDRVNSERHANIVYKIAQATDLMKSHGDLGKFSSTDEFVDELQKYIKINKRCDSEHLQECWTTSKVKNIMGDEYEVKDAKQRRHLLGYEINQPNNNNVGLILADGAHIILTYNPDFEGVTQSEAIVHTPGSLPVGEGREEFLNYTSNTMGGMSFVFDVNGNRGPNSEMQGNHFNDIVSFNGARFPYEDRPADNPCDKYVFTRKLPIGGTCYFELPTTYTRNAAITACQNTVSGAVYAGSPNYSTLQTACNNIKNKNGNGTTAPFSSGWFFSEGCISSGCVYDVKFPGCNNDGWGYGNSRSGYGYVLCIGH